MKKFYVIIVLLMVVSPVISFAKNKKAKATMASIHTIPPDSSECYAAKKATVCGLVYGYYFNPKINGSPTFLDMGASYPHSTFTVLIADSDLYKFHFDLQCLVNNDVCFTGVVTVYNNKPEMMVSDPMQIAANRNTMQVASNKKSR